MIDGLARNPSLPPALIHRIIAARASDRVAARPGLTAAMIDAAVAAGWSHTLALNTDLPPSVYRRLARSPEDGVRAALAARDGRPHDVYAALIDDPYERTRVYLAENETVPAELRARLAHDPSPEVRATLGRWWTTAPASIRRILLTDPEDQVREYACHTYHARRPHPVPPADLLPALAADPITRAGAIRHLPDITAALASDPDDDVRCEVAVHPRLAPALRDRLGADPARRVRVAVFSRPDTPAELRRRIHHEAAVARQSTATDPLRDIENEMALTELENLPLPWVTADPLPHVDSPFESFRAAAARNTTLPSDVERRLLDDDHEVVRLAMFRTVSAKVDPETAERIDRAFGPHRKTAWRPADDYTFPPAVLRRFATDDDPRMRCLAPRDPSLPAALCERSAADTDPSVRLAVADHPNLPLPSRRALLADESTWVANEAAASPHLPVAEMERLVSKLEAGAGSRASGSTRSPGEVTDDSPL